MNQLIIGDALETLRTLPELSVQTCVTSPPYWGLRNYGVEDQLGLEPTPEQYVKRLVAVFDEVRRVLRDNGTLWLNLGDSYSGSGKGGNPTAGKQATNVGSQSIGTLYGKTAETAREAAVRNVSRRMCAEHGIKLKQLLGIPWRVAFTLQDAGWYLRSDIIWSKPNPMPESVTDRPTRSHEYIFLFSKSPKYYYDAAAIAEPCIYSDPRINDPSYEPKRKDRDQIGPPSRGGGPLNHKDKQRGHSRRHAGFNDRWDRMTKAEKCSGMRNKRDVWTVAPAQFRDAHFATFPPALIEPCILAGCPPGGVVLDPFAGSGTTGEVAAKLGREYVLIELNPKYERLIRDRLGLFAPNV